MLPSPLDEVASRVSLPRADQRHIWTQGRLEHAPPAVELSCVLALRQRGAVRRKHVDAGGPRPSPDGGLTVPEGGNRLAVAILMNETLLRLVCDRLDLDGAADEPWADLVMAACEGAPIPQIIA